MAMSRRWAHEMQKELDRQWTDRRQNSLLSDKQNELDSYVVKVEMAARVLWECLCEMGVTSEELELKINEIRDRGWSVNPPSFCRPCPKCGRKVYDYSEMDFEATCAYCGQILKIYPGETN